MPAVAPQPVVTQIAQHFGIPATMQAIQSNPAAYAAYKSWAGAQPDLSGGLLTDALSSPVRSVFAMVAGLPLGAEGEVGAVMPPAIPEPDPTFGGALQQTAPGVFSAAAGAETLGAAAGPPIPPVTDLSGLPGDFPPPPPDFPAPPLASDGISYAGLPAGDPSAPGTYGSSYSVEPGGFEPNVFDAAKIGSESINPLDWLKQLAKTASPYLNLASAGLGLYSASRAGKTPSPAPVYDPFAGQRGQYQQQLSRLSTDPNYLTELPGYKAGIEATRRGMAAGGYNISGNEEAALFQYGGNVYNQEATRLANLAGANIGPMVSGASPSNVAQADLVSRSLASLGYAARSFATGG